LPSAREEDGTSTEVSKILCRGHNAMVLRAAAMLALCLVFSFGAFATTRVALVVGNSNYLAAPLENPKNDADDLAAALRGLQFDVTERKDLKVQDFDRVVDDFVAKAKDADVALFFFSGHGVQIDKRGFLAPVDAKAESESSALRELVSIQDVVARIENAAKVSVIVLDACRDSPLQERLRRVAVSKTKGIVPPKGLPPVSVVGSDTLIVYATVPGETAIDGAGRNSPFTASLVKHIATPGLEIELMFKRVTADVLKATAGKQQPERLSRLQGELVLADPGQAAVPQQVPLTGEENGKGSRKQAAKAIDEIVAVPEARPEERLPGLVRSFTGHKEPVRSVAFSPDGRTALSGSRDRTMKLWDLATGNEIRTFAHKDDVLSVAFSPDRRAVLSGSSDALLRLWDVATGREIRTFTGHKANVYAMAFSPDAKSVLSGSGLSTAKDSAPLKLWDAATGKTLRTFAEQTQRIVSVAFSPDGKTALAGGDRSKQSESLKLWDVTTGNEIRQFAGHDGEVNSVAFSPKGRFALSGSNDKTIKLWDIESGKTVRTLTGHVDRVDAVAFSPDGRYILSGGSGPSDSKSSHCTPGSMKLWIASAGEEVADFAAHACSVFAVAFSPDGRFALSGGGDNRLKLWDLSEWMQPKGAAKR
jgi:WD40 repeat protein